MSDAGDDLFGDEQHPVASGSRSTTPAKSAEPGSPRVEDDVGDLFGDDDDEEDKGPARRGSPTATPSSSRTRSRSRSGSPNPLEYAEEDEAGVNHQEDVINIAIPQWPKLNPTDGKVWHMKLPAYVNIESKPFDPDLYRETLNDEPVEGNTAAKSKMIGVRNTIRWKWVTGGDGEMTRQSNARMLRWSDGSVSLQLGSDMFDVAPSHGATLARPQDPKPPVPAHAAAAAQAQGQTQSSTTFLCVAAQTEKILVAENAIAGQLSLLPTSMNSKTHMELVKHVGQQHVKHSRMKMLEETQDEASLQKLLLKSASREIVKPKAARKSGAGSGGVGGANGGRGGAGRGGGGGGGGGKGRKAAKRGYSSDEDSGSDSDGRGGGGGGMRSRRRASTAEYDDDGGFVVADSEDEDEYGGGSKKKKGKGKKRKGSDAEDLDEMEEAERIIEERERERKRIKKDNKGGNNGGAAGATKKSREYVDTDDDDEADDDAEADGDGDAVDDDAEGEEEMDMEMDVESEED